MSRDPEESETTEEVQPPTTPAPTTTAPPTTAPPPKEGPAQPPIEEVLPPPEEGPAQPLIEDRTKIDPIPTGPVQNAIGVPLPADVRREITRGYIAVALLAILGVLVVGSFVSLWFGWATSAELDALLTLLFAPIIGLVGAATGFYFGERAAEENSTTPPSGSNTDNR